VTAGRRGDLGDPQFARDIHRLAELGDSLVADQIGVPGETDRGEPVLVEELLDPLQLGIVGVAPHMLGPARHARQLDGAKSGAGNAVERLLEAIGVIRIRRRGKPISHCTSLPQNRVSHPSSAVTVILNVSEGSRSPGAMLRLSRDASLGSA
jgi:hypothetical protein